MSEIERPSPEAIRIGRLERKVSRMRKRREALEAEIAMRDSILRFYPDAAKRYDLQTMLRAAERQVRELTAANREQAATISALTKAVAALGA